MIYPVPLQPTAHLSLLPPLPVSLKTGRDGQGGGTSPQSTREGYGPERQEDTLPEMASLILPECSLQGETSLGSPRDTAHLPNFVQQPAWNGQVGCLEVP